MPYRSAQLKMYLSASPTYVLLYFRNGQEIDITEGGKILVISQETENSPIIVRVNFTNDGENAFDVRLTVTYDSQINWINVRTMICCKKICWEPVFCQ